MIRCSADEAASSWKSGSSGRRSISSPTKKKEVADSQLKALALSVNAQIYRTSSVTGEGVSELFQAIAEDLAPGIVKRTLCTAEVAEPCSLESQENESSPAVEIRQAVGRAAVVARDGVMSRRKGCCS